MQSTKKRKIYLDPWRQVDWTVVYGEEAETEAENAKSETGANAEREKAERSADVEQSYREGLKKRRVEVASQAIRRPDLQRIFLESAKDPTNIIEGTDEQCLLLRYRPRLKQRVVVQAVAGSGKTTLCKMLCRRLAPLRVLYLAYNRMAAAEAKQSMPENVDARTIHSLALMYVGGSPKELNQLPSYPLTLRDPIALRSFDKFCRDPKQREPDHFEAILAWRDILRKKTPFTYDAMLKKLTLDGEKSRRWLSLKYDAVIVDEAQDSQPAFLDWFERIDDMLLYAVGDRFQSIYSFNGTVNAMQTLKENPFEVRDRFGREEEEEEEEDEEGEESEEESGEEYCILPFGDRYTIETELQLSRENDGDEGEQEAEKKQGETEETEKEKMEKEEESEEDGEDLAEAENEEGDLIEVGETDLDSETDSDEDEATFESLQEQREADVAMFALTKSFRFGSTLGLVASDVLRKASLYPDGMPRHFSIVIGQPGRETRIEHISSLPEAFSSTVGATPAFGSASTSPIYCLARQNITLVRHALQYQAQRPNARIAFFGNVANIMIQLREIMAQPVEWRFEEEKRLKTKSAARQSDPEMVPELLDWEKHRMQAFRSIEKAAVPVVQALLVKTVFNDEEEEEEEEGEGEEGQIGEEWNGEEGQIGDAWNDEEAEWFLNTEADVHYGTVHASKGLEFDNVAILDDMVPLKYACEWLAKTKDLPNAPVPPRLKKSIGKPQYNVTARDQIREEVHLVYVAMTRAKKVLYLGEELYEFAKNAWSSS